MCAEILHTYLLFWNLECGGSLVVDLSAYLGQGERGAQPLIEIAVRTALDPLPAQRLRGHSFQAESWTAGGVMAMATQNMKEKNKEKTRHGMFGVAGGTKRAAVAEVSGRGQSRCGPGLGMSDRLRGSPFEGREAIRQRT